MSNGKIAIIGLGEVNDIPDAANPDSLHPKGLGCCLAERVANSKDFVDELILIGGDKKRSTLNRPNDLATRLRMRPEAPIIKTLNLNEISSLLDKVYRPDQIVICSGISNHYVLSDPKRAIKEGIIPDIPEELLKGENMRGYLLPKNIEIITTIASQLQGYFGEVLIASNPPDILAAPFVIASKIHPSHVFGFTSLDTSRFRKGLQDLLNEHAITTQIPECYILGGHQPNWFVPYINPKDQGYNTFMRLIASDELNSAEENHLAKKGSNENIADLNERFNLRIEETASGAGKLPRDLLLKFHSTTNTEAAEEIMECLAFLKRVVYNKERFATKVFSRAIRLSDIRSISCDSSPAKDRASTYYWRFFSLPVVNSDVEDDNKTARRRINRERIDMTLGYSTIAKIHEVAASMDQDNVTAANLLAGMKIDSLPGSIPALPMPELLSQTQKMIESSSKYLLPGSVATPLSIEERLDICGIHPFLIVPKEKKGNTKLFRFDLSGDCNEEPLFDSKFRIDSAFQKNDRLFIVGDNNLITGNQDLRELERYHLPYLLADAASINTIDDKRLRYFMIGSTEDRKLIEVIAHKSINGHDIHLPNQHKLVLESIGALAGKSKKSVDLVLGFRSNRLSYEILELTDYTRGLVLYGPYMDRIVTDEKTGMILTGSKDGLTIWRLHGDKISYASEKMSGSNDASWAYDSRKGVLVLQKGEKLEFLSMQDKTRNSTGLQYPISGRIFIFSPFIFYLSRSQDCGDNWVVLDSGTGKSHVYDIPNACKGTYYVWVNK